MTTELRHYMKMDGGYQCYKCGKRGELWSGEHTPGFLEPCPRRVREYLTSRAGDRVDEVAKSLARMGYEFQFKRREDG